MSIHWFAQFCCQATKCPSLQCFFYNVSGWPKFAYVANPVPLETRGMTYKLHSQWHSRFYLSILPVFYTQSTFVPFSNFEVGHFAHHFLFLSFGVVMKGIQFTQLRCHISYLLFTWFTTCFLSSRGRLLNSCKCWLFCLHIQHDTHCLFEWQTPVGSSETAVCRFCLSISLHSFSRSLKADLYNMDHLLSAVNYLEPKWLWSVEILRWLNWFSGSKIGTQSILVFNVFGTAGLIVI